LAIFLAAAILVALILPTSADEPPGDPFGNHTAELNEEVPLVSTWNALRVKLQREKSYFLTTCFLRNRPAHRYPRSFRS
jgi:hypothetical protein